MSITSITTQPATDSLNAAYAPMIYKVVAEDSSGGPQPPVVYCDIYFNGTFYKTISKTVYEVLNVGDSEWQFDIKTVCQEFLRKYLPTYGGAAMLVGSPMIATVQCKFRASGYNANQFVVNEGLEPVQATSSTPAVAGDGFSSNTAYVLQAAVQHEDNPDFMLHLDSFKTGEWDNAAKPLTHRPAKYFMHYQASDYFAAVIPDTICLGSLTLKYRYRGQLIVRTKSVSIDPPCTGHIDSISYTQQGGTDNITFTWAFSGAPTSFDYKVDAGAWLNTTANTVTLSGYSIGTHTFYVKAKCACSDGNTLDIDFDVFDPITYVCTSSASISSLAIVDAGQVEVQFSITGAATDWEIRVTNGAHAPIVVTGSLPTTTVIVYGVFDGDNTIVVTPICSNGVRGTPDTENMYVGPGPAITKIHESNQGIGGLRTQKFQVGTYVSTDNRYVMNCYGHDIIIIAVLSDTPNSIATKLKNAINATSEATWNTGGFAPPSGTNGFPPTATSSGDTLTVVMNHANGFSAQAYFI